MGRLKDICETIWEFVLAYVGMESYNISQSKFLSLSHFVACKIIQIKIYLSSMEMSHCYKWKGLIQD